MVFSVAWPHVTHLTKESCLGASNTMSAPHLLWCQYNFCRWRYVFYLLCDPTRSLCWDVMRICWWELLVACHHPESLVTIGIVIVMRKIASSKKSYKYILTLKAYVDWIITRWEKNVTNRKMVNFEKKCPEIKKRYIFPLWLPSITLLLKWKPVELKRF